MARKYWLFKSEPTIFSIRDLKNSKNQTNNWDGVRNYQARNFLRDDMKPGDGVLFYHSNVSPIGIAGEAVVTRGGYPDHSAFDPKDHHFDPGTSPDKPIWFTVDIRFVRECRETISLQKLRSVPALKSMKVLQRGMRLSVLPVTDKEWKTIMNLPEWNS